MDFSLPRHLVRPRRSTSIYYTRHASPRNQAPNKYALIHISWVPGFSLTSLVPSLAVRPNLPIKLPEPQHFHIQSGNTVMLTQQTNIGLYSVF